MLSMKVTAAAALFVLAGNLPALSQAAIQEPGLVAFYHPEIDVTAGRNYGGYVYNANAAYTANAAYSANAAYVDAAAPVRVRPDTRYRHYQRTRN